MQEKSWEIKEIPAWVSQKGASALRLGTVSIVDCLIFGRVAGKSAAQGL